MDLPISGLPPAGDLGDGDLFAVVQGGITDQCTLAQILAALTPGSISALVAASLQQVAWVGKLAVDTPITSTTPTALNMGLTPQFALPVAADCLVRVEFAWIQISTITALAEYEFEATLDSGTPDLPLDKTFSGVLGQGTVWRGSCTIETIYRGVNAGPCTVALSANKTVSAAYPDIQAANGITRVIVQALPTYSSSAATVLSGFDFRVTESGDLRVTESGDSRILG